MDSPRLRRLRVQNSQEAKVLQTTLAKLTMQSFTAMDDLSRTQAKFQKRYASHLPPINVEKNKQGLPNNEMVVSPVNYPTGNGNVLGNVFGNELNFHTRSTHSSQSPRTLRRTKLSPIDFHEEYRSQVVSSVVGRNTKEGNSDKKKLKRTRSQLNNLKIDNAGKKPLKSLLTRSNTLPHFAMTPSLAGKVEKRVTFSDQLEDDRNERRRNSHRNESSIVSRLDLNKGNLHVDNKNEDLEIKSPATKPGSDLGVIGETDERFTDGQLYMYKQIDDSPPPEESSHEKFTMHSVARQLLRKQRRAKLDAFLDSSTETLLSESELNPRCIFGSAADEIATTFARKQASKKFQKVIRNVFRRLNEYKIDDPPKDGAVEESTADWGEMKECRYLRVRDPSVSDSSDT